MNHFLNGRMNHKPRVRISLSPDLQLLICNFFLILNFFEVGLPFFEVRRLVFCGVFVCLFVCLFLATLGLGCCAQAFSSSLVVGASLVAQRVKCLRAMREAWVRPLGREDILEEEMATRSSILA